VGTETETALGEGAAASEGGSRTGARVTRRQVLKYGLAGAAGVLAGGYLTQRLFRSAALESTATVLKGNAPAGELWEAWKKRGWAREARHYLKVGSNVLCKLCPNDCLLQPNDRGRCRNRVNKEGKLYTLVYGNPCTFHPDPVEKKPLYCSVENPSSGKA